MIKKIFPGSSVVKNLPANAGDTGDTGSIPVTCSSILAWEIPWTKEPGGLQSMGLPTVGHSWAHTNIIMKWEFYPSQMWERLAQPHWLWKRVDFKLERYSSSPAPRGPPQILDHPSSWSSQGNPKMAWFHWISWLWKALTTHQIVAGTKELAYLLDNWKWAYVRGK